MTNETISSGAESGFGGAAPGTEFPITFSCEGVTLLGILHKPTKRAQTGLVMVVGGPQYRVGGHRKFVNIARDLAAEGTAVLRFDCRGMGDSEGDFPGFESLDSDIVAAISALTSALPSVERIILWGLCDGASAICLCAHKLRRIGGVILINPWVRSETSAARAYLKHYYASHLFDRSLWRKIWRGEFDTLASIRSFARMLAQVISGKARGYGGQALSLPERMALGLKKFGGPNSSHPQRPGPNGARVSGHGADFANLAEHPAREEIDPSRDPRGGSHLLASCLERPGTGLDTRVVTRILKNYPGIHTRADATLLNLRVALSVPVAALRTCLARYERRAASLKPSVASGRGTKMSRSPDAWHPISNGRSSTRC